MPEDKDLSDPANIAAKQFRTDFRLRYPFFLGLAVNLLRVTPFTSNVSRKKKHEKNCIFDPTDDKRRVAFHNPVGKITDRKPASSILVSDCIRSDLRAHRVGRRASFDARRRGNEVPNTSRDENQGTCRSGEGGEEPAVWPNGWFELRLLRGGIVHRTKHC